MNNQEELERQLRPWVLLQKWIFRSEHSMWHRTNARIKHTNVELLLHYQQETHFCRDS